MTSEPSTVAAITVDLIRQKIHALSARERELIERQIAHEKATGGNSPPRITDDDRKRHDRVRRLLNGAAALIEELPESASEIDVLTELGDVRFAIATLNRASVEKLAVESAEWAVKNTPSWRNLVREWLLAVARFNEIEARCEAFLDAAGRDRGSALPWRNIPAGHAFGIELGGYLTIKDVFAMAVSEGLVKASEVRNA